LEKHLCLLDYDVNIDECKQVIKYLSWYSLRAKLPILWKWTKLKINKKNASFLLSVEYQQGKLPNSP
jgi:hypothetical protein